MRACLVLLLLLGAGFLLLIAPAGAMVPDNGTPVIRSIDPAEVPAGTGPFTLNVTGTGFTVDTVIEWNGTPLLTELTQPSLLSTVIPGEFTGVTGQVTITVACNDGQNRSTAVLLTISPVPNPVPAITAIDPDTLHVGTKDVVLNVTGSGFVPGSAGLWNGYQCAATYYNATFLSIAVPATFLGEEGSAYLQVYNPPPGGGTSGVARVVVLKEPGYLPVITSVSPDQVESGGSSFLLNITGGPYATGSVCLWNGTDLKTHYIDLNHLQALVPASLISEPGNAQVQVFVPRMGLSDGVFIPVTVHRDPVPVITGMSPLSVIAGSRGITLSLLGTGFTKDSVVLWGGEERSTRLTSSGYLVAAIPATDLASPGSVPVTVMNPPPGGGRSEAVAFQVLAPGSSLTDTQAPSNQTTETETVSTPGWNEGNELQSAVDPFVQEDEEGSGEYTSLPPTGGLVYVDPFESSASDEDYTPVPPAGTIHLDPFATAEESE